MKVSGAGSQNMQAGGAGMSPGMNGAMDEAGKSLQKQIENLQKQMKELSSNQEMTPEMKMKKRQELQKQISELEMQLRQHQMEVKREEARKKEEKTSQDNVFDSCKISEEGRQQSAGLSAGSMEAMISADVSMKQAAVHGSTADHMEHRARILESEIARDKGGPGDATAAKEEELVEVKARSEQAAASQMESLGDANKTLQEASETERENGGARTDDEEQKTGEAGQQEGTGAVNGEAVSDPAAQGIIDGTGMQEAEETRTAYHPVDVRI